MTDLTGKVALVTGSARGIGRAIVLRLAGLGANVVINYVHGQADAESTRAAAAALGVRALAIQTDVAVVEDVRTMFDTTVREFGQPDIVVVNAGLEHTGLSVVDFTEDQYDRMFAVNTKGAFFTMQEAARRIRDNGRILYIGSSTTGYPMPGYALHGGSKVAPEYLVRVLAHEIGSRGITVNAILPTATEGAGLHTAAGADAPIRAFVRDFNPMSRMGTGDDVANVAEFFAGPLSSFVSGQVLTVSGGALA